jgi:hypothetical protein
MMEERVRLKDSFGRVYRGVRGGRGGIAEKSPRGGSIVSHPSGFLCDHSANLCELRGEPSRDYFSGSKTNFI